MNSFRKPGFVSLNPHDSPARQVARFSSFPSPEQKTGEVNRFPKVTKRELELEQRESDTRGRALARCINCLRERRGPANILDRFPQVAGVCWGQDGGCPHKAGRPGQEGWCLEQGLLRGRSHIFQAFWPQDLCHNHSTLPL